MGECPNERPGERADLAILYEYIKDGLSNYEIMEANPDHMLSLEKIERARQAVRKQQYRETFRKLETTYIWGPTGTGKTRFTAVAEAEEGRSPPRGTAANRP